MNQTHLAPPGAACPVSDAELTPHEVETLNAHGPYNHATWEGRGVVVTSEEVLAGRGALLANLIRSALLQRFSLDEIASKTIADIGCYDGFVLHQLSDLPFRRMIGFEPRAKNIIKGQTVRRLLRIESRCEFEQARLEEIEGRFDIIICTGLLHHLSDPIAALTKLRALCHEFMFLETLTLPDNLLTDEMRASLELKDLPYLSGESFAGFSGQKLESGYLDGSATGLSLVSVPSMATLHECLKLSGFGNIDTPVGWADYTAAVCVNGQRSFSAVCFTADAIDSTDADATMSGWIESYERGMLSTLLPREIARELYEVLALDECRPPAAPLSRATMEVVASDGRKGLDGLKTLAGHSFTFEIVKNMRFNSADKASLEYSKSLMGSGQFRQAEAVLRSIVRHINADWRASFRAFALLAHCADEAGDQIEGERYRLLSLSANPQYPRTLLYRDGVTFAEPQ